MAIEGSTEYCSEEAQLYNRYRWWLGLTWGDVLDKASDLYPRKVGLVDDNKRLTYLELRQKVDCLALGLMDLGIKPTDPLSCYRFPTGANTCGHFSHFRRSGRFPSCSCRGTERRK